MNPKEPVVKNLAAEIINREPPKIAHEEKIVLASIVDCCSKMREDLKK
jgi:hypothetical protein